MAFITDFSQAADMYASIIIIKAFASSDTLLLLITFINLPITHDQILLEVQTF